MELTVIVPTYNEAANVVELVRRVARALSGEALSDVAGDVRSGVSLSGESEGVDAEILFVDDSTDVTPDVVRDVAAGSDIPVRLIHRDKPRGGLGGAVVEGMREAHADVCLVMDGDLQHPPEDIPTLLARYRRGDVDLVVASRYLQDGSAQGLADRTRVWVSKLSTLLTKAMFPIRLHTVSDPMTGFFLVDRRTIGLDDLHPRGFKILLEILARRALRVAEVPFTFADRYAGSSKATMRQGLYFLTQLTLLRFGKMSLFALIGALGAVANLAIMWVLIQVGVHYLVAAVVGAELTIVGNFILQERFVFQDMTAGAQGVWMRFAKSFAFNNVEALVRIPMIAVLVNGWHLPAMIAAAITLALAFIVRFMFHSLVVYAPRKQGAASSAREVAEELDARAMTPGEL